MSSIRLIYCCRACSDCYCIRDACASCHICRGTKVSPEVARADQRKFISLAVIATFPRIFGWRQPMIDLPIEINLYSSSQPSQISVETSSTSMLLLLKVESSSWQSPWFLLLAIATILGKAPASYPTFYWPSLSILMIWFKSWLSPASMTITADPIRLAIDEVPILRSRKSRELMRIGLRLPSLSYFLRLISPYSHSTGLEGTI